MKTRYSHEMPVYEYYTPAKYTREWFMTGKRPQPDIKRNGCVLIDAKGMTMQQLYLSIQEATRRGNTDA